MKLLRAVEVVLRVEDGEHPLVEVSEEPPEGVLQVDLAVVVVGLEVLEEVDEDVRVALVDDAVRLLKELVKLKLRFDQEIHEVFWKGNIKIGCKKNNISF